MAATPTGPALVAQRVSVNQVNVDRWEATVPGPNGPADQPFVLCEGPMHTRDWFIAMLAMAAAAAAARLAPAPTVEHTAAAPETPPAATEPGDDASEPEYPFDRVKDVARSSPRIVLPDEQM